MAPFMRCTKCQRTGNSWEVTNEAYACPRCGMDESGLEMLNPQEFLGTWWVTARRTVIQLIEWYGNNNFRAVDQNGTPRTVSILSLVPEG
jgi:hypothetical protein